LLDIGCGYGYFLAASRSRGYEVCGLDLSEWAQRYARGKLGISVTLGSMQKGVFAARSFDIITMWHFLEHTPDPDLSLRQAGEWLKEGGILVVDVPNYEGTDARYLRQAWDGWCLPYHLWHFTRGSLITLLQSHGFRVVKYKDYHSEVIKKKLRAVLPLRPLARLIARLGSGSSVAVAAVRQG
jgi:SAM-dependent methyltransferase